MHGVKWKLLYDGECETCTRFARQAERFDTEDQLVIASLQEHYRVDTSIPMEELLEEVHLVSETGEVLRGGEAIRKILTLLPRLRPFRWMIESRWGEKSARAVYRTMTHFRRCRKCR